MLRATEAILRARASARFTEDECSHRRADDSAALNVGIYYGGGAQAPGNLNNGKHAEVLEELVADPDISRLASFADGKLHSFYYPSPPSDLTAPLPFLSSLQALVSRSIRQCPRRRQQDMQQRQEHQEELGRQRIPHRRFQLWTSGLLQATQRFRECASDPLRHSSMRAL